MIKSKILFLFFVLLLIACEKDEPIEENNNDVIIPTNYLVDISSQWTVRDERQFGAPYPFDDYLFIDTTMYYFDGDTSLSRLTVFDFDSISNYPSENNYNKLHYVRKEYEWNLTNENPSTSTGTLTITNGIACYIRQDTLRKRVYVVRNEHSYFPMLSDDKEYVLYDFSLSVNDPLPYNAWNGGISTIYAVDTLESVIIDGKNLKLFKVYENNYYYRGTIIEGVGSLNGFLGVGDQLIHFQNNEIDFYPELN